MKRILSTLGLSAIALSFSACRGPSQNQLSGAELVTYNLVIHLQEGNRTQFVALLKPDSNAADEFSSRNDFRETRELLTNLGIRAWNLRVVSNQNGRAQVDIIATVDNRRWGTFARVSLQRLNNRWLVTDIDIE